MPLGSNKVGLFGAAGSAAGGARGIGAGGYLDGDTSDVIQYITIGTLGNASDFGDLLGVRRSCVGMSNGATDRGIASGGTTGSIDNVMQYVTISTAGDATDFGNLSVARTQTASTSNGTDDRGVTGGGSSVAGASLNTLDYVTISSTGDAADFGDATTSMQDLSATSNGTNERGVWFSGNRYIYPSGPPWGISNIIDYITINSAGNATDFGDISVARTKSMGFSNGTNDRGVAATGYDGTGHSNVIDYITISSTGNSTDFGDATASNGGAGTSSGTEERGILMGGYPGGENHDVIEYVTINSAGNSADFGNLLGGGAALAAFSNA